MSDLGWSRHIAAEEAANWGACFDAAAKHGVDPNDPEACDDREHDCPECPWREATKLLPEVL